MFRFVFSTSGGCIAHAADCHWTFGVEQQHERAQRCCWSSSWHVIIIIIIIVQQASVTWRRRLTWQCYVVSTCQCQRRRQHRRSISHPICRTSALIVYVPYRPQSVQCEAVQLHHCFLLMALSNMSSHEMSVCWPNTGSSSRPLSFRDDLENRVVHFCQRTLKLDRWPRRLMDVWRRSLPGSTSADNCIKVQQKSNSTK